MPGQLWRVGSAALAAVAVAAAGAPTAAAPAAAVEAWDTTGAEPAPCPEIDARDVQNPRGGCSVEARSGDVTMSILSVVGKLEYADCLAHHDMYVDASGRTVLDVLIGGTQPCNDIRVCDSSTRRDYGLWEGRLERAPDGTLRHRLQICLHTCLGYFTGEVVLPLRREGARWRMRAAPAAIGTSGFELDGAWRTEPLGFEIRDAVDAGERGSS